MKNVDSFSQIKGLLQKIGGRYIIIENGRAVCVVSTLEDYSALVQKSKDNGNFSRIKNLSEKELIEKINQDISFWKEGQEIKKSEEFTCENENDGKVKYVKENEDIIFF